MSWPFASSINAKRRMSRAPCASWSWWVSAAILSAATEIFATLWPSAGAARCGGARDPPRQPQRQALRPERGGGSIKQAFGFDLTPLVARAAEFERLAGEVRAEARARHLLREEVSLQRRDIAKTIATAIEENLPGPWSDLADRFRQLGGIPPRSAGAELLEALACDLRALRLDVDKCLAESTKTEDVNPNESQCGAHHQTQGRSEADEPEAKRSPQRP